jgi:parallel beta-helix repeat protein
MKVGFRRARIIGMASVLLWACFLGGGLAGRWAESNLPLGAGGLQSNLEGIAAAPSWSLLFVEVTSLLLSIGLALTLERILRCSVTRTGLLVCSIVILSSLGGGLALWAYVGGGAAEWPAAWPSTDTGQPCDYSIRTAGNVPLAESHATGLPESPGSGQDFGSFFTGLIASGKTFCFAPGDYSLTKTIRVVGQDNVTLYLAPGARITTNDTIRLLQVIRSSGVAVVGGTWVGPGKGEYACIEVDLGSNDISIKGADVSHAGHDGILFRNDTAPNLRISVVGNFLHENGRYGVQDFEISKSDSLKVLFSGNMVKDNSVGGIYTNGVGGVEITSNTVRNTVGTTPGLIGIGVTNGENDSVTYNRVDHMFWYGIQVFYNNYTAVANNYSSFNAGGSDQSGITNDHSFYDSISNNTTLSNGQAGIHVERSWFVSVTGNVARNNGRFGIEFYHGDMTMTAKGEIVRNYCSYNGQAGIILNSGVDILVSGNSCLDNSGSGILLYNDLGEVGSSGNTITHNSIGDDRSQPAERTQTYGLREVNQADNNTITSNVLFNNSVANIAAIGSSSVVSGNIEDSGT